MRQHLLPFIYPILLAFLFAWLRSAGAQEFVLDSLIDPVALDQDGTTLTVTFDDLRSDISDTHYEAQQTSDLTTWIGLLSQEPAVADSSVAKRFSISALDPDTERRFYRILVFTKSATDSDGDGLSDAFEAQIGTDPNLTDSDGDGFNDGEEYAVDTDPKNAASHLSLSNLPTVSFVHEKHTLTEGDGTVSIPLTVGENSPAFSGTVNVVIRHYDTAASGVDYTAPGTASLSNGIGSLSLTLLDNTVVSQELRVLTLEVQPVAGTYNLGANFQTTIVLMDNDTYWTGMLAEGRCQTNIRLCSTTQGTNTQFSFVAGAGNDGLLIPEEASGTDQSTGIIPSGTFAATVDQFTATQFDITSAPLPMPSSSLFGDSLQLARTLRLQAEHEVDGGVVTDRAIGGAFEVTAGDTAGGNGHLSHSKAGIFVLIKDIPLAPFIPMSPNFQ